MPSTSKIKGSGYEREVARFLTEHYGETFTRNISGSGAYVGGSNSYRKKYLTEQQVRHCKGDIVPPESFNLLNCEAKFYSDFQWHQLFDSCAKLDSWLEQLLAASDIDDLNVLFFKINRRGQYVAVQANDAWNCECSHVIYSSDQLGRWMVYSIENFFKLNSNTFKYLSNKHHNTLDQVKTLHSHIN
jgi:hypothetical protein